MRATVTLFKNSAFFGKIKKSEKKKKQLWIHNYSPDLTKSHESFSFVKCSLLSVTACVTHIGVSFSPSQYNDVDCGGFNMII